MTNTRPSLSTPKRAGNIGVGKAALYSYYAGYSPSFVRDVIGALDLKKNSVICDPWNGSGTTTQVAQDLGYSAFGYDINPAMVTIAKARLLGSHTEPSHSVLCSHILRKASNYCASVLDPDPLTAWFIPESARFVRNIERAVQHMLVDEGKYLNLSARKHFGDLSSLAAFFYVALFRTVRQLLTNFVTSNPTWLKIPSHHAARVRPTSALVRNTFRKQVTAMASRFSGSTPPTNDRLPHGEFIEVTVADSRSLPLPAQSIDAVIGSPPYCTRLDYIVATRPELFLMGYDGDAVREIRDRMIGTTTINSETPAAKSEWGSTCNSFLEGVRTHESHASDTYYWKNHVQYFDALHSSLGEIQRVLRPKAACVLVVQDSYYKEIHNDLPIYIIEMAGQMGLSLRNRYDYVVKHSFAGLHEHRKTYRSHATAIESVLWFVRQ